MLLACSPGFTPRDALSLVLEGGADRGRLDVHHAGIHYMHKHKHARMQAERVVVWYLYNHTFLRGAIRELGYAWGKNNNVNLNIVQSLFLPQPTTVHVQGQHDMSTLPTS